MSNPSATYTPLPDAAPETETGIASAVYRFILECHAKRTAAEPTPEPDGRDGTTIQGDSASVILPD